MKRIGVLLLSLLLIATVTAQLRIPSTADLQATNLDIVKQLYNANINSVPDIVRTLLGNGRMHIFLERENGEMLEFAAFTDNGVIVNFGWWEDSDGDGNHDTWQQLEVGASMNVRIKEATLYSIAESEDPINAFLDAWGSDIKYEGIELVSSIKIFFVDVVSWFGFLF